MSEQPLLEVAGISKSYPVRQGGEGRRELWALDDVDLTVAAHTVLGIVGESGCGKSTLAKTIVLLEQPTRGSVRFAGADIHALRGDHLRDFRRRVQMVFQDPYGALPPRMDAGTAVAEPLKIAGWGDAAERDRRVAELLELVGLPASLAAAELMGIPPGQRQRVNIARAIALDPELLVLDEPVSALDVSVQAQVLNLLRELRERVGLTYLFISHDLRVVRYLCDEVAVMYLGRIVERGPALAVFSRPAHPYTAALLGSIPDLAGESRRAARTRLRGEVPSPIDRPAGCPFHPRCPMARDICRTERPELRLAPATGAWSACHFADEAAAAATPGDPT
ncbi:MAG: ABC transporter ATP-binding protein [Chloroflexota bacterium]